MLRVVIFLLLISSSLFGFEVKFRIDRADAEIAFGNSFQLILHPLLESASETDLKSLKWELSPDAPDWVYMEDGILEGVPLKQDIGTYDIVVFAHNHSTWDSIKIKIDVTYPNEGV